MRSATTKTATGGMLVSLMAGMLLCAQPAHAQIDLSGHWDPLFSEDRDERIPGPEIGDYLGLPINDAARLRADSWESSLLTLPEHQCKPHPSTYGFRGVGLLRIWPEWDEATQQMVALHTLIQWQHQLRTIWLDGRSHPPDYAAHTWQGFSTGTWEGDTLIVRTTHLKAGWMRRNGLALSDQATMTERFIRHGDSLTHISMVEDPAYLTEPLIKTNGFQFNPHGEMQPYPCQSVVEVNRPQGEVPHYLPGTNPYLHEFADRYELPFEATRGGAGTALPEYGRTLRHQPDAAAPRGVATRTGRAG